MQVYFVSTFAEFILFVAVNRVEFTSDMLGAVKHLAEMLQKLSIRGSNTLRRRCRLHVRLGKPY